MQHPFSSLDFCLLNTLRYSLKSSLKDKKKLRNLIVINRGNLHYR